MKWAADLYQLEVKIFQRFNRHFDHKILNSFFHFITHAGGAGFTIGLTVLLVFISIYYSLQIGFILAVSLGFSHLPVMIIKKCYPRRRPYLVIDNTKVTAKPLKDFSFPSGHTTAIFSLVVPLTLYQPILGLFFVPLAILVGISRIFLGLHYPTDILCGAFLGTVIGYVAFIAF